MSTEYLNGVRNYYGPRVVEDLYGAEIKTTGPTRVLEWVFNWDDLPAAVAGDPAGVLKIPAYSIVKACTVYVIDGLVGTTPAFTAGITGTTTGFVTATEGASGLLDADGDIVLGNGALVNKLVTIGAAAEELIVGITGSPTAGRFKVIIEYMQTPGVA